MAVLGLSFKPDTDDLREAPALDIIRALLKRAACGVQVFDPVVRHGARRQSRAAWSFATTPTTRRSGADALVLVTEWNEFRRLDLAPRAPAHAPAARIVDLRNVYDPGGGPAGCGFDVHLAWGGRNEADPGRAR